jgi:D-3-phosphoglycerate dehydrogenase / 2-oxoglutarate reductase
VGAEGRRDRRRGHRRLRARTPPADHPLLAQERLLATPHTAFYSDESMRDLARLAAENVAAVLAGRQPASLVNPQILEERR